MSLATIIPIVIAAVVFVAIIAGIIRLEENRRIYHDDWPDMDDDPQN